MKMRNTGKLLIIGALGASLAGNVSMISTLIAQRDAMNSTLLIGRECQGAFGSIYAKNEDQLPLCLSIERIRLQHIAERDN
jgi:hypothetical protein